MTSIQSVLSSIITKSMPGLTSQLCGDSLPAVYYKMGQFINQSSTRTLDRLKKEASVKADH